MLVSQNATQSLDPNLEEFLYAPAIVDSQDLASNIRSTLLPHLGKNIRTAQTRYRKLKAESGATPQEKLDAANPQEIKPRGTSDIQPGGNKTSPDALPATVKLPSGLRVPRTSHSTAKNLGTTIKEVTQQEAHAIGMGANTPAVYHLHSNTIFLNSELLASTRSRAPHLADTVFDHEVTYGCAGTISIHPRKTSPLHPGNPGSGGKVPHGFILKW